jgi:hypothetical protein
MRVVLRKLEHRGGDTHLAAVAILVVQLGQGLFDVLGVAEAYQSLHQQSPRRKGQVMRRDEAADQCLSGAECRQRLCRPAAGQFEQPAYVVDSQRGRGRGFRAEGAQATPAAGSSVHPCRLAISTASRLCSIAFSNER